MSNCILTYNQFQQMVKNKYASHWYEVLEQLLPDYDINTPLRVAHFIAQTAHESGNYAFIKENLNYRAESLTKTWPRLFPTIEIARQYEKQPQKIANRAYGNRMGNGDEASGDGYRFCGRGLIQLTGRSNYTNFAMSIETPVEEIPAFLQTFEGAVQSACWFWENNNLNRWADAGDIEKMTRIINGGTIGLEDRKRHYEHALHVLGA
jgi:putative chitinase